MTRHFLGLLGLFIFFTAACGKGTVSDTIFPPDLPNRLVSAIPGSNLVSWAEFVAYKNSNQIKILSKDEVETDLVSAASQTSLDALKVSAYAEAHPHLADHLLNHSNTPGAPKIQLTYPNGGVQPILLQDNLSKLRNISEAIDRQNSPLNTRGLSSSLAPKTSSSSLQQLSKDSSPVTGGSDCVQQALPPFLSIFTWPNSSYLPCQKDQSIRGTCTAFAATSALEILASKTTQQFTQLSVQALYNQGKMLFPMGSVFDEGYTVNGLLTLSKNGYRIPPASSWSYNSSVDRSIRGHQFINSCDNFNEYCSDTVHQGRLICAQNSDSNFYECGYIAPIGASSTGVQVTDFQQLWNPADSKGSVDQALTYLALGYPVVAEASIYPNFINPSFGWISTDSEGSDPSKNLGGHAFLLVGYLPPEQLLSFSQSPSLTWTSLQTTAVNNIPAGAINSSLGFVIVVNSWSQYWGDSGFAYLPINYLQEHAYSLVVVKSVDVK